MGVTETYKGFCSVGVVTTTQFRLYFLQL